MKPHFLIAACLLAGTVQADTSTAERLVRNGNYADAIKAIGDETTPEAEYWRGQALLRLGRLSEAALAFSRVPQENGLYEYAAKGLLYCAWQNPDINFVEAVAPLTADSNSGVARTALAALAEYQLRHTRSGDTSTLEQLRQQVGDNAELNAVVRLLDLESLRRRGLFDEAVSYARTLENDATLSPLMKQRVRLSLAEVYYAKDEALSGTELQEGDVDDEGRGEETLLQFIAANPDSPLLEEAFRRLREHGAFDNNGGYAAAKLKEWSNAAEAPHRATLALAALQRMRFLSGTEANDATYANIAGTMFPEEPSTRLILQERIRELLARDKRKEAELYLRMLQRENDARTAFFRAVCLSGTDAAAAKDDFLQCAAGAPSDVRAAALANALICAHATGDEATVQDILNSPALTSVRRLLLITHAELLLDTDTASAVRELEEALTLSPTPTQKADIIMDLAQTEMTDAPTAAEERLKTLTPDMRAEWNDERQLRYVALMMTAADNMPREAEDTAERPALKVLRDALAEATRPAIRRRLSQVLAAALSDERRHEEALQVLEHAAAEQTTGDERAKLLLVAGRTAERLGNMQALRKAEALYREAAELNTGSTTAATAYLAGVLVGTDRNSEGREILEGLLRRRDSLTPDEHALTCTFLADALFLSGSDDDRRQALETCAAVRAIPGVSTAWQTRATLQHAVLNGRMGQHSQALADYLRVLATHPAAGEKPSNGEWFILYAAASGAISEHLELGHYEEAALLAERIAVWPYPPGGEIPADAAGGDKAAYFAEWAAGIRRVHYLQAAE